MSTNTASAFAAQVAEGIPAEIPDRPADEPGINRAPKRPNVLSGAEQALALRNALRYFPARLHPVLAREFAGELREDGRIVMRRYRPHHAMHARPLDAYPARSRHAAAIMLMIQNNLDPKVAQHPYELITYGGNGAVFQNWAQYRLTMKYLSEMTDDQTLVLYSGHPLGLFPSHPDAPRAVVTNGMVVPNHSTPADYHRLSALGVTSYGQMTAGSFMYIGPQGIVHGTVITLLNAGRKYLGTGPEALAGRIFVTSGLGGMSGAQAKAAVIAGAVGIVAEVNEKAVKTRFDQGWVMEVETDLDRLLLRAEAAKRAKEAVSIAFVGNVVDLWERLAKEGMAIDLGSDQTSLHNPDGGGYYPVGISFEAAQRLMREDAEGFKTKVRESLLRHVDAIGVLAARGMRFWDYGNAFLLEAARAGAAVTRADGSFLYPSYVEDIMGPMCFDFGFGPFRWVCTTGEPADLATSDAIAAEVLEDMASNAPVEIRQQMRDNAHWIRNANDNQLVVGSQARILYADGPGRERIALALNAAVRDGRVLGSIVLGRDHHDVSGTDSPYRETANIRDGSNLTADMAVHNVIGDAFRGATWVSLHNGGGVGWGEAVNGGFGMVIDGSADADRKIRGMIAWDVNNGIARRAWARNEGAEFAIRRAMVADPRMTITMPEHADDAVVNDALTDLGTGTGTRPQS
jgi:urocanate hydratase